jgi:hypothetical protein
MSPRTLLVFLLMLFQCSLFAQKASTTHSLKLDLVGIPLSLIHGNGSYPRVSLEYEHRMMKFQKLSWIADFEISRQEETYIGKFGGNLVQAGNIQKTVSAIAGFRYYLFRAEEKNFFDIFFVEPRIAFSGIFAKLIPYTFTDPIEYKSGFSIRPRVRAGIAVPLTSHIGLELSGDFAALKLLGSGRNRFSSILELDFVVAF